MTSEKIKWSETHEVSVWINMDKQALTLDEVEEYCRAVRALGAHGDVAVSYSAHLTPRLTATVVLPRVEPVAQIIAGGGGAPGAAVAGAGGGGNPYHAGGAMGGSVVVAAGGSGGAGGAAYGSGSMGGSGGAGGRGGIIRRGVTTDLRTVLDAPGGDTDD